MLFGMEGSGMTFGKIGARKMMNEWNNPYVTDGLVAMWDAEWNAGGGVHDAAATKWMDLVGTKHLSVDPSANFTSNSLSASLLQGHACAYSPSPIGTVGQIEVCASFNPDGGWVSNFIFMTKSSSTDYCGIGTINRNVRTVYFKNGKRWEIWNSPFGTDYFKMKKSSSYMQETPLVSAAGEYVDNFNNANIDMASPYEVPSQNGVIIGYVFAANGTIDISSIRVYSRALTAAELASNHAVDKRRFNIA